MSNQIYQSNSGIYTITNKVNGKILVGYASDFKKRKNYHFTLLKEGNHKNDYLQNAVNKDGIENFEFDVLEYYPNEGFILPSMENYWCNLLNTHNRKFGYNIRPTNPYDKVSHSEETKKKISEANKGKKWTEETRKIQRNQRLGKKRNLSEETLNKIKKGSEKPINQLNLQGELVKSWESITKAGNELNIGKKYVSLCCRGLKNSYKQSKWEYQ